MITTRKTTSAAVLGFTAVALALSACAPSTSTTAATSATSGAADTSGAAATSGTATPSASPSGATSPAVGPSPSASTVGSSAPTATTAPAAASPTAAPTGPATAPATTAPAGGGTGTGVCTAAKLSGTVAPLPGGGAAGSVYTALTVRNTSGAPCRLSGYPGVSFVGGGNGEQIGVPADRELSQPPVDLTLAPGQSAQARLQLVHAENYGQVCNPTPADGFRVYPPSATDALFIPYAITACGNPKIILAHVGAFQHSL